MRRLDNDGKTPDFLFQKMSENAWINAAFSNSHNLFSVTYWLINTIEAKKPQEENAIDRHDADWLIQHAHYGNMSH